MKSDEVRKGESLCVLFVVTLLKNGERVLVFSTEQSTSEPTDDKSEGLVDANRGSCSAVACEPIVV